MIQQNGKATFNLVLIFIWSFFFWVLSIFPLQHQLLHANVVSGEAVQDVNKEQDSGQETSSFIQNKTQKKEALEEALRDEKEKGVPDTKKICELQLELLDLYYKMPELLFLFIDDTSVGKRSSDMVTGCGTMVVPNIEEIQHVENLLKKKKTNNAAAKEILPVLNEFCMLVIESYGPFPIHKQIRRFIEFEVAGGPTPPKKRKNRYINYFKDALRLNKQDGNKQMEAVMLGALAHRTHQSDNRLKMLTKAAKIHEQLGNWLEVADLYAKIGHEHINRGHKAHALICLTKSLELYQRLQEVYAEANVLTFIGYYYFINANHQKEIEYYKKAVDCFQRTGCWEDAATYLSIIGEEFFEVGKTQEAFQCILQELSLRRRIGNKRQLAACLCEVGNAYFCDDQLDKALGYFVEAEKIWGKQGVFEKQVQACYKIGKVYYGLEQYKKGSQYLERGLLVIKKRKDGFHQL